MLIEDKTVSGTVSFVSFSLTHYYYISRLGIISILIFYFTPKHLGPSDCYLFFCSFVVYMFVIKQSIMKLIEHVICDKPIMNKF